MVNGYPILDPPRVRAQAIVDLISRYQRPWIFRVEVWATQMPFRQVYEIEAASDDDAASQGLKRFELDVLAALRARN
jgi:hypothetical protein